MSEDKILVFARLVARKAGLEQRLVGRFTFFKLSESPAARRRVFSRVLDHQLKVNGNTGNEGLGTAKDLVVFLRVNITPCQSRNNRAIRKRKLSFSIGFYRQIVAKNCA